MNREIKFRVWDKRETKGMSTQNMLYNAQSHGLWQDFVDYPGYELMQYTGLNDINGKQIYEGDIIRGLFDFGPAGFNEEILIVTWDNERGYQWNYWDLSTIEVIGNIFENPELLK
jgi:hypothetical protein